MITAVGWTEIEWFKMYNWYGLERMSKQAYRSFHESIKEAADDDSIKIRFKNGSGRFLVFIEDDNAKCWETTYND